MCGIIGYWGTQKSDTIVPILIKGLKRLEYRGYDSYGVCIKQDSKFLSHKEKGKIPSPDTVKFSSPLKEGRDVFLSGIGHTRWATHGIPSKLNAHPHFSEDGNFVIVHNGIIENAVSLRENLRKKHNIISETDSELIAHMLQEEYEKVKNVKKAIKKMLTRIKGAYSILILNNHDNSLYCVKQQSPLIIGKKNFENSDDEYFVSSSIEGFIEYTKNAYYMEDGDIIEISDGGVKNILTNNFISFSPTNLNIEQVAKGGYDHFMLKEINEQDKVAENIVNSYIVNENIVMDFDKINFSKINRIIITACGTSWHAGLIADYYIEEFAKINVEVDYASEFRYKDPIIDDKTLLIVISQSGETADTLAALEEAKKKGAQTLAFVNVLGSTISKKSDDYICLQAGPEIGVASTKAFTSQILCLLIFALKLGREKGSLSLEKYAALIRRISELPKLIKELLSSKDFVDNIRKVAKVFDGKENALFMGRKYNFPIALEGSLKLKEISYIHSEGLPAAEMKHGHIALVDENMPVIFISSHSDFMFDKLSSNIEEIYSRGGLIVTIGNEVNDRIREISKAVIHLPKTEDVVSPIVSAIPLQLLAYYVATARNLDVDQPRNLAKSVTVE